MHGQVPPQTFIPLAEESGLIVAVGQFVLETACRQFMAWQRTLGPQAPASLAVNLSPVQLRLTGLVAEVQRCIIDNGMAPQALQLEVTESLAAQDETARSRLREIQGDVEFVSAFGQVIQSLAFIH